MHDVTRPPSCRAGWPTTCSGSAATPSGSRPPRACSACSCRASPAKWSGAADASVDTIAALSSAVSTRCRPSSGTRHCAAVVEPAAPPRRPGVRPRQARRASDATCAAAAAQLGSEGTALARHLARAATARRSSSLTRRRRTTIAVSWPRSLARRRGHHALGLRRAAGRESDARLRLALPGHRPPHGTGAADARTAARRRRRAVPRRRVSRGAAAGRRQLHHLSLALSRGYPHPLRARAPACATKQPAIGGVSGRRAARRRPQPAGSAAGTRAAREPPRRRWRPAAAAAAGREHRRPEAARRQGKRLALERTCRRSKPAFSDLSDAAHGALPEPLGAVAAAVVLICTSPCATKPRTSPTTATRPPCRSARARCG